MGLRERALGSERAPPAMVIIWTVTDTIASPQKLTMARLSPPGRETVRQDSFLIAFV